MKTAFVIHGQKEYYSHLKQADPDLILVKKGEPYPSDVRIVFESPIASGSEPLQKMAAQFSKAQVFFPRPLWPGYQRLKKEIEPFLSGGIHMEYTGNLWGLTHNGAHYIHLFRWLMNSKTIRPLKTRIVEVENKYDPELKEYVGEMRFQDEGLNVLQLYCNDSSGGYGVFEKPFVFIKKADGELLYKIEEVAGRVFPAVGEEFPLDPFYGVLPSELPFLGETTVDQQAIFDALALLLGKKADYQIGGFT